MLLHQLPLAYFYEGRILNFAHRGARMAAPENTLEACTLAADLGADGIELDVQLSADGVPVVMHNFTVDETTDGSGKVADMPLAALKELDAGSHFSPEFASARVPTLDEVFQAVGERMLINVELKTISTDAASHQALVDAVVWAIQHFDLIARVIISSFNPLALRTVKKSAPDLPVGYLYAPDLPLLLAKGWLARPVIGPHEARNPEYTMVDPHYMQWARKRHYRVNVWTVNEVEDIRRMRDLGVDMIISDRPELVQDVLQGER